MANISVMGMALRKGSFNKQLAAYACKLLNDSKESAQLYSMNDYPMAVYNGDDELAGIPPKVQELAAVISGSRALVLSCPEYNGGIAGPLKNLVDWVSRVKPMPWEGKHILLLGASPGALGAIRGLLHTRVPLEITGAFVFPEMFGLPKANEAFDEQGALKDPKQADRLKKLLLKFIDHVK